MTTRTTINPTSWPAQLGYAHGELVIGPGRLLFCAGQAATDETGAIVHDGDVRAQLEVCLANLEAVLAGASMTMADVVRLNVYTTDVSAVLTHYDVVMSALDEAGVRPPGTFLGVAALAFPGALVEIEATAAAD